MNKQTISFQSFPVTFRMDGYLNATTIANHLGKRIGNYLRNERTKEYIQALMQSLTVARKSVTEEKQLVIIKQGGKEQGTWLHPKLAVDFARWLSPEFAVWCDVQIERILYGEKPETTTTNPDERAGLRAAVTVLTTKRGLMHGEAYKLVHQRFNVEHIEEIPREKLGEAVEYVHRLALEGEYIPCKDRTETEDIRHHQVCAIAMMHAGRMRYEEQKRAITLVRNRTAEAHERLKAINRVLAAAIDETGETLDLANSILHGSGAIWDGLHEALFHLYLPDDVMKDGKRRAQEHYKPRILA